MSLESFLEKVTKTSNLQNRVDANLKYAGEDFWKWMSGLTSGLRFQSVLDVCCGTGNQLVLYAKNPSVTRIIGVDVSASSLAVASGRLNLFAQTKQIDLVPVGMEEMFSAPALKGKKFDLISCFYGLYYSQDVARTLAEMIEHLSDSGTLMIVGPYGPNNGSLFEILRKFFELPELVTRSASTFMEQEVLPILEKRTRVSIVTLVNPIRYPDVESIITYWKSSTFYSQEHEKLVRAELQKRFAVCPEFLIEKHIMAFLGRKK